ncbi:hypothetical protein [Marivita sp.]|uniref:hypothetical protein n=1 Tax=Marivita sp. TaxID=2003365 RepID=UPI003A841471
MSVDQCVALVRRAVARVTEQVNAGNFSDFNEATIQHHLAFQLHLDAVFQRGHDLDITLEKKIRRAAGNFPKKNRATANIDIFFQLPDDGTRCAVELKCFHYANHREPNNRYDVYADLANLEIYLEEHADVGVFVLFTDHRHYFDNTYRAMRPATSGFNTREGHQYHVGTELVYDTVDPYGPPPHPK